VARLLACFLAQDGHPVVLLDHLPNAPETEDTRLYALSPLSLQILETHGLYSELGPKRCRVFSDLEIWVYHEPTRVRFSASDIGGFLLGGLVYARDLNRVLMERVSELGIPTHRFDPDQLERTSQGWVIGTGDAAFQASLLVVAEGSHSRLRERFRIPVETRDYGEEALTFGLATEHDLGSTPRQVFTPWGPLGLLPAPDGTLSGVWSMPAVRAREWLNRSAPSFEALLSEATEGMGGRLSLLAPPRSFPLRCLHAQTYVGDRLALAGDAAHVIHPFAGQGLNLGFLDACALADDLKRSGDGSEAALRRVLMRYDRRRRRENQKFLLALEGVRMLFRKPDLLGLRALMLGALAQVALLRRPWVRRATGSQGRRLLVP